MGWGQRWPERKPRPTVQRLSDEQKEQILQTLTKGVKDSYILSSLGIQVKTLRDRFYLERIWKDNDFSIEIIGRISPLNTPSGTFLLEVEKTKGNWFEVKRGSAKKVICAITDDTKGTFHGLGFLEKSLRQTKDSTKQVKIEIQHGFRFIYSDSGKECTVQEALHHLFGVPIEIIAEPREWYWYHRQPIVREVSEDQTKILVDFIAMSWSGESFGGSCLYMKKQNMWQIFKIRPNQSSDIATAVKWLEKRQWKDWQ
jgi:hypothetical protein